MDNKNLPAYPNDANKEITVGDLGLSKRELIAAMCLQGFISNGGLRHLGDEVLVSKSVELGDALLTHLENTSK